MTASATRVAYRHLTAGGTDFEVYVKGSDPKRAFRQAVDDAGYERGHGGYSGTIAEKSGYGFQLRSRTPMTSDQAREFVDKDLDRNDKWGPAFAVPVSSSKVLAEKEYVVKIKAKSSNAAREKALEVIKAKGKTRKGATVTVSIPYGGVKELSAGGVPPIETEKEAGGHFTVNGRGQFGSKKDAVVYIKKTITGNDEYAKKPGTEYHIAKVTKVAMIKVTGEASKLPTFEVTGTRKQVAMGKVEGYLFYGIASS